MFENFDGRYNHMPFAVMNAGGEPEQFCCIKNGEFWKLCHYTGSKWKRVKTGLPADATECGPTAELEDGLWKISFIAGGWEGDRRFRLYRMYGISGTPMAQEFADVGYVRKDQVVSAGRRGPITIIEPERKITLTLHGVEYLYRVSYDPFRPNRMLISGQYGRGEIFSWTYQPGMKLLNNVTADGVAAYKCAFYRDECFYAKREAGFEERRIVKAECLDITPLAAADFITETEEFTGNSNTTAEFE